MVFSCVLQRSLGPLSTPSVSPRSGHVLSPRSQNTFALVKCEIAIEPMRLVIMRGRVARVVGERANQQHLKPTLSRGSAAWTKLRVELLHFAKPGLDLLT